MPEFFSKNNNCFLCLAFFACIISFCGYAEVPVAVSPVQTEYPVPVDKDVDAVAGFYFIPTKVSLTSFYLQFHFITFLNFRNNHFRHRYFSSVSLFYGLMDKIQGQQTGDLSANLKEKPHPAFIA